ncbi:hypothetical protein RHGRI_033770 [Rhododendron griersonianum]|uniref:J domain-containing protein n=1 Tax=Rhododendron griersonianum TaxID=479676 RepID=A0AAV6HY30_9ERIC|nr:hypothetical protein RHGRI_033770 [Rhododendron griersonianum]
MRGKGKSVAHSKSRTCSGRKTLKRCKNKGEADNVVLIDVDSDDFDNVIIVDVPESLKQKLQAGVLRKGKKCLIGTTVICIDDDDDDDSDTSSSGRFSPASSDNQNSANEVGDDCQFVPEKFPPLNLSKSKRTYSGKVFNGNRYGDSYSSDNDSPDCEVMEDSFGKLREQWEKANMKKKSDVRNGQYGRGDQVSTSELRNGTQHDVEVENITNQPTEANVPISSNASSDKGKPSGDSGYRDEPGSKQVNTINRFSSDREHTLHADYHTSNPKPTVDPDFGCSKDNLPDEEGSYFRTQLSVDKEVGGGGREENIEQTPSSSSHFPIEFKNGCYQEEAQNEREMRTRELSGEFMPDHLYEEPDVTFHAQDGDVVNAVDNCIINEREKLKETDEYKRAVEEEWVSRQRELQLQAEEAQKLRLLRKRMKAENLRLLDMERRQKQRVEEIREVQKQDEEKMNLKEQIRAEVRKELKLLEIMCRDMASLLRGLGIQVRAAYKRALLRFHPDRASGSDLRQLVEAEEKFKLISRMKEKFLS